LSVQLYICPTGAPAPTADTTNNISPCPACKVKPRHRVTRRHRGRHDDEE